MGAPDPIEAGQLESVAECLALVDPGSGMRGLQPLLQRGGAAGATLGVFHSGRPIRPRYGVWFRGHADVKWQLTPTVFRDANIGPDGTVQKLYYEEVALYHSFRTRVWNMVERDLTAYEWLCIMRHHALPTRLLDWSESILVALFFAVEDPSHDGQDSCLYVLNAYALNDETGLFTGIATPATSDVVVRASMVLFYAYPDVFAHARTQKMEDYRLPKDLETDVTLRARLCRPVATVPNYIHNRLTVQSSVFTLHGGKKLYNPKEAADQHVKATRERADLIDEPVTLEQVAHEVAGKSERKILLRFTIPSKARRPIREHLEHLGIHRGMLFPDLENQAVYLAKLWRQLV